MSHRRRIGRAMLAGLASLLITSLCVTPIPARALGRDIHKCIANSASNFWSFPRLSEVRLEAVKAGARHEDEVDHIWDHYCVGIICYQTCTHFWEPDGALDATPIYDSNTATYCGNAWMKANELLDSAIWMYYAARDPVYEPIKEFLDREAWERLGHVTHLIGDVAVPAHVHVDLHPTNDSFDDIWAGTDGVYNSYCAEDGPNPAGLPDLANYGGFIEIPNDAILQVLNSGDPGFGLPAADTERQRLYAKLFYLMYTTAQRADVFASDDYDGDTDDPRTWMNGFAPTGEPGCGGRHSSPDCYPGFAPSPRTMGQLDDNWTWVGNVITADDWDGDWSRIAESTFLQSMRAVATFYRAFRDAIDAVPPVTAAEVGYQHDPNAAGWTRGAVTVYVSATDDHSGVYQSYTQDTGATERSVVPPVGFVNLSTDGVHELLYWSQDWFGNLENPKTVVVRIDQTSPVIDWTVPSETGFYRTNEALTIDWSAHDATSGIALTMATLDGVPVVKGQVFDLALMAGSHTFTLEVTDVAGNLTTVTESFSVWIDATADVKPDRINSKAGSDPISAYIEFPAPYDVSLIYLPSVGIWYQGGGATAYELPTDVVDLDHDRLPERMARCSKAALLQILRDGGLPTGVLLQPVEVIVQGALLDGTRFYAVETLEISHF